MGFFRRIRISTHLGPAGGVGGQRQHLVIVMPYVVIGSDVVEVATQALYVAKDPFGDDHLGSHACTMQTAAVVVVVVVCEFLTLTASLAWWLRRPPRERKIPGSNPACTGIFFGVESYQSLKIGHFGGYPARRLAL